MVDIGSIWTRLDEHIREIIRGTSITFGVRAAGAATNFAVSVVVARLLGADGAGLYFLSVSVVTILATVGMLGLDKAVLRFVSSAYSGGRWREIAGVLRKSMLTAGGVSLVVGGALTLGAPFVSDVVFEKPELGGPLSVMALAIPCVVLARLYSESLKGIKRILYSQITWGLALPVVLLPALFVSARQLGIRGAAGAYVAASAVAMVVGLVLWWTVTPRIGSPEADFSTSKLVGSANPLFVTAIFDLGIAWASTLLLGVWGTAEAIGIFNAAHRTSLAISLIFTAVNSIAAPKFSELFSEDRMEELGITARNTARITILLAMPVLVVFIAFPETVMSIFGSEFEEGGLVLTVLAIAEIGVVVVGSVGYLLIMAGREREYRNITSIAAVVSVILNVVLIPDFGAVGAAVATGASRATLNLGSAYRAWRSLGIRSIPLELWESAE